MSQPKPAPKTQTTVSKGVKRIVGVIVAAAVVYACVFLFMQNQAQAAEPAPPTDVTAEVVEEPVEAPSRLKQAFGFLFDGDATAIVAEYEQALASKAAELDSRSAAITEREIELADAEASVAAAKEETQAYRDAIKAKHDALTSCVLQAMKGGDQ